MGLFGPSLKDIEGVVKKYTLYVVNELLTTEENVMAAFDDVKTAVEKYIADVGVAVEAYKAGVQAKVDEAIAAYKAGEAVDFDGLVAEVNDADGKLTVTPPEVPTA